MIIFDLVDMYQRLLVHILNIKTGLYKRGCNLCNRMNQRNVMLKL